MMVHYYMISWSDEDGVNRESHISEGLERLPGTSSLKLEGLSTAFKLLCILLTAQVSSPLHLSSFFALSRICPSIPRLPHLPQHYLSNQSSSTRSPSQLPPRSASEESLNVLTPVHSTTSRDLKDTVIFVGLLAL